jgi:hypothetical protein
MGVEGGSRVCSCTLLICRGCSVWLSFVHAISRISPTHKIGTTQGPLCCMQTQGTPLPIQLMFRVFVPNHAYRST